MARKFCQSLGQLEKILWLPVFEAGLWLVTFRGTVVGKTGKTLVLPWSCELEHGGCSRGTPPIVKVLPSSNSWQFSVALLTSTLFELKSNFISLASTKNVKLQIAKAMKQEYIFWWVAQLVENFSEQLLSLQCWVLTDSKMSYLLNAVAKYPCTLSTVVGGVPVF